MPVTIGADGRPVDPAEEAKKKAAEAQAKAMADAEAIRVAEMGRTAPPGAPGPQGGSVATTTATGTPGDKPGSDAVVAGIRAKKAAGIPLTPEEEALLFGYDNGNAGPTTAKNLAGGMWGSGGAPSDALTALRDKFLSERAGVGGPAPTLNTGQSDETRGLLLDQAGRLRDVASGLTPSIADAQRKSALFDVNQTALGAAGAARGDAGAGRTLFRSLGDQGRRAGLDAAMLKAQEVSQANQLLGGLLGDVRTGDTAIAEGNLGANLKSRGLDIDERMGLGKLGLEAQTTESETRLREAQIKDLQDKIDFAYEQLKFEKDNAKREFWGKVITGSIAALASVGAASAGAPG